jgi:hypothetical protein
MPMIELKARIRGLSDEQLQEIINLYLEGYSSNDIAPWFNRSQSIIEQFLANNGVIRTRSEAIKLSYARGKMGASLARLVELNKPHNIAKKQKLFSCGLCSNQFNSAAARSRWCKECVPNRAWRMRASKYGIGLKQWERMLEQQNGKCALCDKEPEVIDHAHVEDEHVRGLLCYSCNLKLSGLEDSAWFVKAIEYMKR